MKVRKIDWSPDEWIAGTLMLNHEQRGVYDTMINLVYSAGGPIRASKEWPRAFGCERERLWKILNELVEIGKITKKYNVFSVERCEIEIEKAVNRIQNARENGRNGGRGNKKNNDLHKPKPLSETLPAEKLSLTTTTTTNISPNGETRASRVAFDEFWEIWPTGIGKAPARKAFKSAIKKVSLKEMLDGVRAYVRNKPVDRPWLNPATWLNQERWKDEFTESGTSVSRTRAPTSPAPKVQDDEG